jgi:hypothetical protein
MGAPLFGDGDKPLRVVAGDRTAVIRRVRAAAVVVGELAASLGLHTAFGAWT